MLRRTEPHICPCGSGSGLSRARCCALDLSALGAPEARRHLAHPRIAAGDELPIVHEITQLMPRMLDSSLSYPEALAELWMGNHREDLDNLRDHYLRRVAQLGIVRPGTAWFTDKMCGTPLCADHGSGRALPVRTRSELPGRALRRDGR